MRNIRGRSCRSGLQVLNAAARLTGLLCAAWLVAGCTVTPDPVPGLAKAAGARYERLGGALPLRLVEREGRGERLYVYIDGDGRPWAGGRVPATDPTARTPLALQAMLAVAGPSLYLGRPCHGVALPDPRCPPRMWTADRYSPAVLDAMAEALVAASAARAEIVLVGYSGGGVLAVLLASRVPRVAAVATVAANLDVAAWVASHGYEPLAGSLDPTNGPPLDPRVVQVHWQGAQDAVVRPETTDRYFARNAHAERRRIAEFDHVCCWRERWPALHAEIEARLDARPAAARHAQPPPRSASAARSGP